MLPRTSADLPSLLTGEPKNVVYGDPLFCRLENKRVRFARLVDDQTVEVMSDEDCRVLPDWRHISHVVAY